MTSTIRIKDLMDENFQDYHKPSMFIATCQCDWKCAFDCGFDKSICQNSTIALQKDITVGINDLCQRYIHNPITRAIVFGGLEPILQFEEVLSFVECLREKYHCNDDIVIYTGYYPQEIKEKLKKLAKFENIIVKFGRFEPNSNKKYDKTLKIDLASDNQFAERISGKY